MTYFGAKFHLCSASFRAPNSEISEMEHSGTLWSDANSRRVVGGPKEHVRTIAGTVRVFLWKRERLTWRPTDLSGSSFGLQIARFPKGSNLERCGVRYTGC